MRLLARTFRAAVPALAVALIAAPAATASTSSGPAMSAADVRSMQAQGVREVIVERKAGVSASEQASLRAQAGVSYVGPGPLPNTEIDRAPAGRLVTAVAALTRDSQVEYAEPNGEVHATSAPNDQYFSQQWALSNTGQLVYDTSGTAGDDIGATYAWASGSTGAGVTVAVVDTGVDSTAPDLQGQTAAGASFLNGVQGTDTQDGDGHGTHVSGIIAAAQNNAIGVSGVAPGAHVMPLKALDDSGAGTYTDVSAAFNYAGQNGIRIVNASLGGTSASQTLEQAIANHPNTLYVVAAGNDGTNNDDPSTPFFPCDMPEANLICVGASDQSDQPAGFSDYGAGSVDLFAPGVNILSTWTGGQYAYADGTSMAAPMVTGTLALMLQRNPSLSAAQLKADLLGSVDPAPQLARLSVTGGELDAAAAVAAATQGVSGTMPPVAVPSPPAAGGSNSAVTPAPTPVAHAPLHRALRLTHVAVRGGRGRRALVFTLSAQARVQITVSGSGRARSAAADAVRLSVSGHRGANRLVLSRLLRGGRLRHGRYALTVRAGNRAVTVALNVA